MFGRNNSASLARRDPARASLLGAISGANFGHEPSKFGHERSHFGSDFGADPNLPGYGFGADGGMPVPTPEAMQRAWMLQNRQSQAEQRRDQLLNPNRDVSAKVERYAMPISQAITLGQSVALALSGNPTVVMRPQRLVCNAPCVFFAFLSNISVANVKVLVGPGLQDAYDYNAEAQNTTLDIPTISPSNPISLSGTYSGLVPAAFNANLATYFTATFIGWASVTA